MYQHKMPPKKTKNFIQNQPQQVFYQNNKDNSPQLSHDGEADLEKLCEDLENYEKEFSKVIKEGKDEFNKCLNR